MHDDPEHTTQQSPEEVEAARRWHLKLDKLLAGHLGTDGPYNYDLIGHLLCFDYENEIPDVWSKSESRIALDQLQLAIETIDVVFSYLLRFGLYEPMSESASKDVFSALAELSAEEHHERFREIYDSDPRRNAFEALANVSENQEILFSIIDDTRQALEKGLNTGNKDIKAWRLVAAAAKLCSVRYKGTIRVPNTMNESGPFYRLLVDLFHHFDLDGSPVAAFRAWVRYVDNSQESEFVDYRSDHVDKSSRN